MLLQWLITDVSEAVFWSGATDGVGGTAIAEEIAIAHGGTTLERLVKERGIHLPPWNADCPVSVQAWTVASKVYASCARGCMRAVLGNDLRPGNIWETVELPALKANPDVSRIVRIDPATGAEALLFAKRIR